MQINKNLFQGEGMGCIKIPSWGLWFTTMLL